MDNFICTHMTQLASCFWRTVQNEHGKVASFVVSKPTRQVHHLWQRNMSVQSYEIAGNMANNIFWKKEYHTGCGSLSFTLASYFMQDFSGRNQNNFGEGIVGLTDHRLIWTQAVINSCLLLATSGLTTWESGLDHPFERVLSLNKLLSQEQYNLKVYAQTPWEASTNLAL